MDLYIALRVAEQQGASIIFGDQEQGVTIRNALREVTLLMTHPSLLRVFKRLLKQTGI